MRRRSPFDMSTQNIHIQMDQAIYMHAAIGSTCMRACTYIHTCTCIAAAHACIEASINQSPFCFLSFMVFIMVSSAAVCSSRALQSCTTMDHHLKRVTTPKCACMHD